jgi:ATPase subunit of ABC transporter with duplicated ATPase domains
MALEAALADCPCALLLVSHDSRFLRRQTRINWHFAADREVTDSFTLHIGHGS